MAGNNLMATTTTQSEAGSRHFPECMRRSVIGQHHICRSTSWAMEIKRIATASSQTESRKC